MATRYLLLTANYLRVATYYALLASCYSLLATHLMEDSPTAFERTDDSTLEFGLMDDSALTEQVAGSVSRGF